MRFSLRLPTDRVELPAEFGSGVAVIEMATVAEGLGYDAVFVTEHPLPSDEWMASGGHHALDPFVALSFAAAASERLRLHTNLIVVPYHDPFVLAKAAASLDALSGGRLVLGVGAGYLEPEFRALGADFEGRNERMDQALSLMKQVWSGESIDVSGEGFEARGHTALPRPAQKPHPPIWIGGNSKRAIRRAVEMADGWMPFPNPGTHAGRRHTPAMESLDDLRERLDYMREHAAAIGKPPPRDLIFMPIAGGQYGGPRFDAGRWLDHVAELAELGVTDLSVDVPGGSRFEWLANAEGLARAVVEPAARL